MIKLKDILNETYKPGEPVGKVITDKDHPPFMSEEQWRSKWTSTEEDDFIREVSEKMTIDMDLWEHAINQLPESVFSQSLNEAINYKQEFGNVDVRDRDNKWVKDQWLKMPHKGKFRQSIIKFVMSLTPNSRSTHHLKRYFATGKISKQAASQVYRDWSKVIYGSLTGVAAVMWASMYKIIPAQAWTLLLIPIIRSIMQTAVHVMLPDLLPGGSEARKHLTKRLKKGTKRLEKQMRDTAKTKKEIDWINNKIKNVYKKAQSGGLFKMF